MSRAPGEGGGGVGRFGEKGGERGEGRRGDEKEEESGRVGERERGREGERGRGGRERVSELARKRPLVPIRRAFSTPHTGGRIIQVVPSYRW